MKKLSGIPVSDGIAIGRVLKLVKKEHTVEAYTIREEDVDREIGRLQMPLTRYPARFRHYMNPQSRS